MLRYKHGGEAQAGLPIDLDFSVNVNPLGMPKQAISALRNSLEQMTAYPDRDCTALRSALHQKLGVGVDQLLCGNGASDLIFRICAAHAGKTALVLAPTFSEYERSVRLFGGAVREFRLRKEDGFAVTDGVLSALDDSIDLLFLCNPNNPTGKLINAPLLYAILERCKEHQILLVVDECFLEFTNGVSLIPAISEYDNLLILRAFTKYYGMAGLRLGYLVGSSALLCRVAPFGPEWNVSSAAQIAGAAALSGPDWDIRTKTLIEAERGYLCRALTELGLSVTDSRSNFLLVESSQPLYRALLQKQILVRACENFSGLDEHFIRIGIRTHEENFTLIRAIREVLND